MLKSGRLLAAAALVAAWAAVLAVALALPREPLPTASAQTGTATATATPTPPSVTSIEFERPLSGDTFGPHELIIARVRFDQRVYFGNGRVEVWLKEPGRNPDSISLETIFATPKGDYIEFNNVVETSDRDTNGLELRANSVTGASFTEQHVEAVGHPPSTYTSVTAAARAADPNLKVNGSLTAVAPTIKSVEIEAPVDSGVYKRDDRITARVQFHRRVTVTGSPTLSLTIGSQTRTMTYKRIEGASSYPPGYTRSGRLLFEYVVQTGDKAAMGAADVSIAANSLSLSGGATIKADNDATTDAVITHSAVAASASRKVDGSLVGAPKVKRIYWLLISRDGETYVRGEIMQFRVEFDRGFLLRCATEPYGDQTCSTAPRLALTIGSQRRYATPLSMGGVSGFATFTYEVQSTDRDTDGVEIPANALDLNGGTIKSSVDRTTDAVLTSAAVPARAKGKADGSRRPPPEVERVRFSDPRPHLRGETIRVQAEFDYQVAVTGTPRVEFVIGSTTRYADYSHALGNTQLYFTYTVQADDEDTDGLEIAANALQLNGGTIKSFFDNTVDAVITHGRWPVQSSLTVDGSRVVVPVFSMSVSAPGTMTGEDVSLGYRVQVTVTFHQDVQLTVPSGSFPRVRLTVGTETRYATYSRILTRVWLFEYRVQASDRDADGVGVPANGFDLNGASIKSAIDGTTDAIVTHGAVTPDPPVNVDGSIQRAPRVENLWLLDTQSLGAGRFFPIPSDLYPGPETGDTLGLGERVVAAVGFHTPITVTGSPRLTLNVGGNTRHADLFMVVWNTFLYFNYVVQADDTDTDGITIPADGIDLNGGSIKLQGGTVGADLTSRATAASEHGHRRTLGVNGATAVAPTVTGIDILGLPADPASARTFRLGETVTARVKFSRALDVTGTPQLTLTVGGNTTTARASFASTSRVAIGGRTFPSSPAEAFGWMLFRYTVQAGDLDLDGLDIAANALALNSGAIRLRGGSTTDATLTHDAVAADARALADGLTSIRADDEGPPVVGEPLVAGASHQSYRASSSRTSTSCDTDVRSTSYEPWVWQRSGDGSTGWSDIDADVESRGSKCTYVYVPRAGDAGKYFRARIPLTEMATMNSGAPDADRYATTEVTAAVVASSTATAGTGLFLSGHAPPRVGQAIQTMMPFVAGGAALHRPNGGWRWRRCDDAAMTTKCVLLQQDTDDDSYSYLYTPVPSDLNKHIEAWMYFSLDSGASWRRWATQSIGPVQAAGSGGGGGGGGGGVVGSSDPLDPCEADPLACGLPP